MIKHYFCDEPNIMPNWYKYYLIIPITEFEIDSCWKFTNFRELIASLYILYENLVKEDCNETILRPNPFNLFNDIKERVNEFPKGANIYIGYRPENNEDTGEVIYYPEAKVYYWLTDEKIVNLEVITK